MSSGIERLASPTSNSFDSRSRGDSSVTANSPEYEPKHYEPSIEMAHSEIDGASMSDRASRSTGQTRSLGHESEEGEGIAILDRLDHWFGGRMNLEPVLRRRHIMMISIGGTVGIGLFLSSSKILWVSGSTGLIVSYAMMGLVVAAVMSCISEMVSLIPEPGAISLFPRRFVDESLGFTVGITYWFTTSISLATLVSATVNLTTYWSAKTVLDLDIGWRITVFLIVLITINVMGVRVYSEIEHFLGWMKILMIVGLTVTMLCINAGAGPATYRGTEYWRGDYKMPPQYGRDNPELGGGTGKFLSVWTSMTIAAFGYVGVEIAAVTAGEAKYPRRDISFAMKYVFLITIGLYVFGVMFASLCVPWNHPDLWRIGMSSESNLGLRSPFLLALKEASYSPALQGLTNAGFLFCAWTAANNNLYAASRTLYGMCQGMTKDQNRYFWPLGRTRYRNGAPVIAILASCIFTPLSYLMCKGKGGEAKFNGLKLLDISSRLGTVGCLMVWGCHCLAFLRFYFGLDQSVWTRASASYPYRSKGQPFTAIFGLVSCFLLVFFNGWSVFYIKKDKPFQVRDLIAAYLWPLVFAFVYITHKLYYKTEITPLGELDYSYVGPEEPAPPNHGLVRNLFEFEHPRPRQPRAVQEPDARV